MASPGSQLPGGFILGALSHADRIGLVYEAFPAEGRGQKSRALVLHPLHVEELREWFERTAVLGRGLKHPNLVEVHALGYTANQLPVMITEWTDGRTLRSRIASGEVIPVSEIRRVIDEVAMALDYLHSRHPPVLHRVLMPETVLIPPEPQPVKLLAVGHADRPQHPASKPNYLSPEELDNSYELTPAADVFSLATLAFEALTNRPAFPGNGAGAVLNAVQRRQLPYIALGPQEGLEPLDEIFHRAWSADPSRRPVSASAFAMELAEALEQVPGTLLTSRRTLRDGVLRSNTVPPVGGGVGRPVTMHPAAVANAARISTRPPPMASRQSSRPISPLIGSNASVARLSPSPSMAALPARGTVDASGALRRADDEANSWLNLDNADRSERPSPVQQEPAADSGGSAPASGPLETPEVEISSATVDIDDPEVLELLSEDFTSPAIAALIPKVIAHRPAQFEGDFADHPPPAPTPDPPAAAAPAQAPTSQPSTRPATMPAAQSRSRFPPPVRALTQPAGFPTAMQRSSPTPRRNDRPEHFDRPPVSPSIRPEARVRDTVPLVRAPWHSRELKVTPYLIALVLALNLVLTAALMVVLRYLLA